MISVAWPLQFRKVYLRNGFARRGTLCACGTGPLGRLSNDQRIQPPLAVVLFYAATTFISAFLLFQVQPIISKAILPWFGGSPAVWTTAMLFFQTLLFAGYAYAHFSAIVAAGDAGSGACRAAGGGLGRLSDSAGTRLGSRPMALDPTGRILLLLAASVGLPYFVLSATGPLVQAWFARDYPGRSPYRLYSLSNVGSLLALLTYPFLIEPRLAFSSQALYWEIGFVVFAVVCGCLAVRAGDPAAGEQQSRDRSKQPAWRKRKSAGWLSPRRPLDRPRSIRMNCRCRPRLKHHRLHGAMPRTACG